MLAIYDESVVIFGEQEGGERVIKATVTFLVLVRWQIVLYHLKAYIYGFILSNGAFSFFAFRWYKKFFPLTSTNKSTVFFVESDQNLEINKIHIARPIFAWEPGLQNMIFEPHKNMPSCKKSAIYLKY